MFADKGFEEVETKGLGWIPGSVKKIDNKNNQFKLPHIGWNELSFSFESKLFKDIKKKSHVYFVHSYKFIPNDKKFISSKTNYSEEIVASVEKENIFGTQFHPEKSDIVGLKIIENFIKI
jgi:glutamine amidotransferase